MTILATIYRRQGIELETDEDWARYEAHKAERKALNVANARDILRKNCIAFEELPHRVGHEQLVAFTVFKPSGLNSEPDAMIPFYPEIGKWLDEKYQIHFGARNLARYIVGSELC